MGWGHTRGTCHQRVPRDSQGPARRVPLRTPRTSIPAPLEAEPGAVELPKDPLSAAGHERAQYQQHQLLWLGTASCLGEPGTQLPAQSCPRARESRAAMGAAPGVNMG